MTTHYGITDDKQVTIDRGAEVALETIIAPRPLRNATPRHSPSEPPPPSTPDNDTPPPIGGGVGSRLRPLLKPSGYFAFSRVSVYFAALAASWLVPRLRPFHALATAWDGSWYILIAQHGYPHGLFNEGVGSRWAFFPAFPATIRATVECTGMSYAHSALLLSFVFGLTSSVAIWLAIREVFGPVVADRSILLYVFFPASYVLSMGYSEGLFLTAAGLCLFAISRRYWVTAALFAGLASVTRNFGVILIACVVVATVPVIAKDRRARPLVALCASGLPFLAWLSYSWKETGTPLAFLKAEQFWNHAHFIWFVTPLLSLLHLLSGLHGFTDGQAVLATGALLFAYVGMALLYRARREGIAIPPFWWVFTIGSVLAMMSPYTPTSVLRYSMVIFPLFAAFAWKLRPTWDGAVAGMLALSQGALVVVVLVGVLHPYTSIIWP
jgi:mannosyltransferase PIG-V